MSASYTVLKTLGRYAPGTVLTVDALAVSAGFDVARLKDLGVIRDATSGELSSAIALPDPEQSLPSFTTDGTPDSATYAGRAPTGAILTDISTSPPTTYVNTGTIAAPTWQAAGGGSAGVSSLNGATGDVTLGDGTLTSVSGSGAALQVDVNLPGVASDGAGGLRMQGGITSAVSAESAPVLDGVVDYDYRLTHTYTSDDLSGDASFYGTALVTFVTWTPTQSGTVVLSPPASDGLTTLADEMDFIIFAGDVIGTDVPSLDGSGTNGSLVADAFWYNNGTPVKQVTVPFAVTAEQAYTLAAVLYAPGFGAADSLVGTTVDLTAWIAQTEALGGQPVLVPLDTSRASGYLSQASRGGAASGALSHASTGGIASGLTSEASTQGVASGESSDASTRGVASGQFSEASTNGTASGLATHASTQGVASGESSDASTRGTASGLASHASTQGTASGQTSHASTGGIASGQTSEASTQGTASGQYSHASTNGTATGQYSHASTNGTATGQYSHASTQGIAEGVSSEARRRGQTASNQSEAEGYGANTSNQGEHARGNGIFAAPGDAQISQLPLLHTSTDATPAALTNYLDGTIPHLTAGETWLLEARIVASRHDTPGTAAVFRLSGAFSITGGTIRQIGTTTAEGWADADASTWSAVFDPHDSQVDVTVTGEAGKTIRWLGDLTITRVGV